MVSDVEDSKSAEMLGDPTRFFKEPEDVLQHPTLDRETKIAILRQWEKSDRLRSGKDMESGKIEGEPSRLARIIRALNALLHDRNLDGADEPKE